MSKILDSIKVSKEVSDEVDETVKILDILYKNKEYLENTCTIPNYKIHISSVMKILILNTVRDYYEYRNKNN